MLRSVCAISVFVCATALAEDDVARVLVDRELNAQEVRILSLDDASISYVDKNRLRRNESVDEYVAMLPLLRPGETDSISANLDRVVDTRFGSQTALGLIELTDGQRYVGFLATGLDSAADEPPAPDTIRWSHPDAGHLPISLDVISRITLRSLEGASLRSLGDDDAVVLSNGDLLSGFIEELTDSVTIEVAGARIVVPLDRVAELWFANPAIPASGPMIWLSDGSIAAVTSIATNRLSELDIEVGVGKARARLDSGSLSLDDVLAMSFDPGAILPLAQVEPERQLPVGTRRWTEPIRISSSHDAILGIPDIEIPGPMRIVWRLPTDTRRFATVAELPKQFHAWGDCELVIEATGPDGAARELQRERLNRDRSTVFINVRFERDDETMTLSIDPGEYGPIQDRIVLRRSMLLVTPGAG